MRPSVLLMQIRPCKPKPKKIRSPTTIGDEAPLGTGVIHRMPADSGLPSLTARDQLMGGVAPGKRPLQSPRQPTGCSGVGRKPGAPRTVLARLLAMLAASAAPRLPQAAQEMMS